MALLAPGIILSANAMAPDKVVWIFTSLKNTGFPFAVWLSLTLFGLALLA